MADEIGCSICVNTIIGTHYGDAKKRHRVVINGENMTIYEEGSREKGAGKEVFAACPVKLRKLEESSDKF